MTTKYLVDTKCVQLDETMSEVSIKLDDVASFISP